MTRLWSRRRARMRAGRDPRLDFEQLESRTVPATIAWDGGPTGNGTDWLDPVNWVGDVLPGAADDVTIGNTGTNPTITVGASTAVRSIAGGRAITLTGGSLGIGVATSTFSNLTLNGGTLDPANGATLNSSIVNGPGTLTNAA